MCVGLAPYSLSLYLLVHLIIAQVFMQELESDRDMRSKLNLYKRTDVKAKKSSAAEGGMEVDGAGTCLAVLMYSFCFR